jgi:hypothetical protein
LGGAAFAVSVGVAWLDLFTALRHFCLDDTEHESHEPQAFLIRRYIAWRNRHAQDRMLREVVKRANVA